MVTDSLAASGRTYVPGQARVTSTGSLKFQFSGHEGNRPYGFACEYTLNNPDFVEWANDNVDEMLDSLAKTDKSYFAVQAANYGDGNVHVQIAGDEEFNRDYGAVLEFENASLANWLSAEADD